MFGSWAGPWGCGHPRRAVQQHPSSPPGGPPFHFHVRKPPPLRHLQDLLSTFAEGVADSDDAVAAIVASMDVVAAWPPLVLENVTNLVLAVGSTVASTRSSGLTAADAARTMQSSLEALLFQAPLDTLNALRAALAPFVPGAGSGEGATPGGAGAVALDGLLALASVAATVPEALQVCGVCLCGRRVCVCLCVCACVRVCVCACVLCADCCTLCVVLFVCVLAL